jgi:hypothetical protein
MPVPSFDFAGDRRRTPECDKQVEDTTVRVRNYAVFRSRVGRRMLIGMMACSGTQNEAKPVLPPAREHGEVSSFICCE